MRSFFDPELHRDYRLITRNRMAKGFYLSHCRLASRTFLFSLVIYNLKVPLTAENLKELWPKVAESLNVSTTYLSDDDFE